MFREEVLQADCEFLGEDWRNLVVDHCEKLEVK